MFLVCLFIFLLNDIIENCLEVSATYGLDYGCEYAFLPRILIEIYANNETLVGELRVSPSAGFFFFELVIFSVKSTCSTDLRKSEVRRTQ